jgi:hypothetical protein
LYFGVVEIFCYLRFGGYILYFVGDPEMFMNYMLFRCYVV